MNQVLGIHHFLRHLDPVGAGVLATLLALSVASWTVAIRKAWEIALGAAAERRFQRVWDCARASGSLRTDSDSPWTRILRAGVRSTRRIAQAAPDAPLVLDAPQEMVATELGRAVQVEVQRMEKGLAVLATASSAAPFVGLFGTVWSIYHALVAIGATGDGGLDKVAGPVGEALVMTGIGLAVAIPALLAYNALAAGTRDAAFRLEGFAQEVFAALAAGPLDIQVADRPRRLAACERGRT